MFEKIDMVVKRWLTAIAWLIVGDTLYKIVQLIAWAQISAWSAQFNMQLSQILSIVLSYPVILSILFILFKPKYSLTFFSHIRPMRLLYLPPNWLFFWIGYFYAPVFNFFHTHSELGILALLLVSIAIIFIYIRRYMLALMRVRNTVPQAKFSTALRREILSHTDHQKNNALLEKLQKWATHEQLISPTQEDMLGIDVMVKQIKECIVNNIQHNDHTLIGILEIFGLGRSQVVSIALDAFSYDYKDKLVVIKINCTEIEKKEEMERYIFNRLLYEVKNRIDAVGIADLPNHWVEFLNGISDNKLTRYFQSKLDKPPLKELTLELEQLIEHSNLHFVLVIEEIERCQISAHTMESVSFLLENLKRVSGLTIIMVFDPALAQLSTEKTNDIDYNGICDTLIHVPSLKLELIEKIFDILCFGLGPEDKNWNEQEAKQFPFIAKNVEGGKEFDTIDSREFAIVARNPLKLQRFILHLCTGWNTVKGTVNFYDFFMVSYLDEFFPTVRNFLILHMELITILIKQKKYEAVCSPDAIELLSKSWKNIYSHLSLEKQLIARKILALLFYEIWPSIDPEIKFHYDFYYKAPQQRITDSLLIWRTALEKKAITVS